MPAKRIQEIRERLKHDSLNDAVNYDDLLWCLDELERPGTDSPLEGGTGKYELRLGSSDGPRADAGSASVVVEQRLDKPGVGGSSPSPSTTERT